MKSPDAAAREPMDDLDFALLDGIRDLFEQADPMPPELPERIRFALAMRSLEAEVARLTAEDDPLLAGARGPETTRTVTFDSDSLTIMIRIDQGDSGMVRIDGWLTPPQRREIDMETTAGTQRAVSDEYGRFAFARVPPGTARLVARAVEPGPGQRGPGEPGPGAPGRAVVTPALVL